MPPVSHTEITYSKQFVENLAREIQKIEKHELEETFNRMGIEKHELATRSSSSSNSSTSISTSTSHRDNKLYTFLVSVFNIPPHSSFAHKKKPKKHTRRSLSPGEIDGDNGLNSGYNLTYGNGSWPKEQAVDYPTFTAYDHLASQLHAKDIEVAELLGYEPEPGLDALDYLRRHLAELPKFGSNGVSTNDTEIQTKNSNPRDLPSHADSGSKDVSHLQTTAGRSSGRYQSDALNAGVQAEKAASAELMGQASKTDHEKQRGNFQAGVLELGAGDTSNTTNGTSPGYNGQPAKHDVDTESARNTPPLEAAGTGKGSLPKETAPVDSVNALDLTEPTEDERNDDEDKDSRRNHGIHHHRHHHHHDFFRNHEVGRKTRLSSRDAQDASPHGGLMFPHGSKHGTIEFIDQDIVESTNRASGAPEKRQLVVPNTDDVDISDPRCSGEMYFPECHKGRGRKIHDRGVADGARDEPLDTIHEANHDIISSIHSGKTQTINARNLELVDQSQTLGSFDDRLPIKVHRASLHDQAVAKDQAFQTGQHTIAYTHPPMEGVNETTTQLHWRPLEQLPSNPRGHMGGKWDPTIPHSSLYQTSLFQQQQQHQQYQHDHQTTHPSSTATIINSSSSNTRHQPNANPTPNQTSTGNAQGNAQQAAILLFFSILILAIAAAVTYSRIRACRQRGKSSRGTTTTTTTTSSTAGRRFRQPPPPPATHSRQACGPACRASLRKVTGTGQQCLGCYTVPPSAAGGLAGLAGLAPGPGPAGPDRGQTVDDEFGFELIEMERGV